MLNFSLAHNDLDRSDMGCLKKTLLSFMRSCHIEELMLNGFQFMDDDQSAQAAIENSLPPEIPARSKIDEITEYIIENISREKDFSNIVYLNLFQNRIKKIKCLDRLTNLNTLILSFNEIEVIEGLQECKGIKRLDLNHNFIRKIEGLDGKALLLQLNLTNNWISDITQIEHLRNNCTSLKELSLKCNPLAAKKSYRATVFSRLAQLIKLDGIAITDKDKERVKNDFITLSPEFIMESLKNNNKNATESKSEDQGSWERTIESLNLNHK